MKTKQLRTSLVGVCMAVILTLTFLMWAFPTLGPHPFAAAAPSAAKKEVIHWKGQCNHPMTVSFGPYGVGQAGMYAVLSGWSKWLESATDGRLVIDWSEPGSIFPTVDADQAVSKGVVPIANSYGSYYAGRIPEADIETTLPFAFENSNQEFEALHKYGMLKVFQDVYAKRNIFWLPLHTHAMVGIGTNFLAPTPQSVKGKKIRAFGIWGEYAQLLGANPVSIPAGEMYMAMKLGTMDGWIAGVAYLEETKLKEVTKGMVVSPNINNATGSIMINMNAFKALPEDIQNLIQNTGPLVSFAMGSRWGNQCNWILKNSESQYGVKSYSWSPNEVQQLTSLFAEKVYPKLAAKSAGCAQLIDIVKKQMKDYGRIK